MNTDRHHDSALCHIAAILLTRVVTCRRAGQPYALRDVDGRPITEAEGRQIVREHHQVDPKLRDAAAHRRLTQRRKGRTDRESQKSQSAPTSRPANTSIKAPAIA